MIHNLPQLEKLDNVAISSQERVSEGLQIFKFSVNCVPGGGSEVGQHNAPDILEDSDWPLWFRRGPDYNLKEEQVARAFQNERPI